MTPERLAEIHEADRRDYTNGQLIRRRPQSAIAQRRELLAHIAELEAEREQLETEWAICAEEPGQVPILAIIDTEDNARTGAITARCNVNRRAVVSVRSRLVGPWRPVAGSTPSPVALTPDGAGNEHDTDKED